MKIVEEARRALLQLQNEGVPGQSWAFSALSLVELEKEADHLTAFRSGAASQLFGLPISVDHNLAADVLFELRSAPEYDRRVIVRP